MSWLLRDRMLRLLVTFALAPLAVIPVFAAAGLVAWLIAAADADAPLSASLALADLFVPVIGISVLGLVGAYVAEIALGLPTFLALEMAHRVTRGWLAFGGLVVGLVAGALALFVTLLFPTPLVLLPPPMLWITAALGGWLAGRAFAFLLRRLPPRPWRRRAVAA